MRESESVRSWSMSGCRKIRADGADSAKLKAVHEI